jgi:hypothetical protein
VSGLIYINIFLRKLKNVYEGSCKTTATHRSHTRTHTHTFEMKEDEDTKDKRMLLRAWQMKSVLLFSRLYCGNHMTVFLLLCRNEN